MATLDQAVQQMLAAGMPPFPEGVPRVNTDRVIRYGPKKKAWYRLYEYLARNGRRYISGSFGCWGTIESEKIVHQWEGIDEDEARRMREAAAAREKAEAEKREQRAAFAKNRARSQWKAASSEPPAGVATYLQRKGVKHEKGIRYQPDGTLLVPMLRYDLPQEERLVGLQKIAPDGAKRFNKYMAKEAAACRLGSAPKSGELVLLTEGLATGLSLREATQGKYAVYVVFDAGNLLPAAKVLRKLLPRSQFLICADDDAYLVAQLNTHLQGAFDVEELVTAPATERTVKSKAGPVIVSADLIDDEQGVQLLTGAVTVGDRVHTFTRKNAGRTAAHATAAAVGNAAVVWPAFSARRLTPDPAAPRLTDFNDLHVTDGLEAVAKQIGAEVDQALQAAKLSAAVKEELAKTRKKEKAERKPPTPPFEWGEFFQRFTLIYPTETAWDAKLEQIVKISAMRIMFGKRVIDHWLESPDRRVVNERDVVFDPSQTCDPATTVNLFRGWKTTPTEAGSCEKLLELIQYLCGERGQDQTPLTDWVLRWCAYPLRHPGAKMQTAVVMYGPEGTGKNLFWGAVSDIYGPYGSLINQFQLQSQFNDWVSGRCFIVANEVVTRMEVKHLVGYLKNLVTEAVIPIETKNMPVRYEENHMQLVFLSNELRPLHISPLDRRYMVVKTPGVAGEDFYKDVAAEIAAGGAARLHHYLLHELEMDGFTEHTKPPMTQAKADLVELGLSSPQLFWEQLHDGLLGLPYGPALSEDLYRSYSIWCARNGERMPARINNFSHEFMAMNGVRRIVKWVRHPADMAEQSVPDDQVEQLCRQRTCFLMGPRSEAVSEREWVQKGIKAFHGALRDFVAARDRERDTPYPGEKKESA